MVSTRFRTILAAIAVGCCLAVVGCGGGGGGEDQVVGPASTGTPQQGAFSLVMTSQPLGAVKAGAIAATSDGGGLFFDVGHIRSSASLFFILGNAGDLPITDIQLTMGNPSFTVTPATIAKLDRVASMSLSPIVKVFANHGTSQTGVGFTAPLPMGATQSTLIITGKTTDAAGQAVDVSVTATIKVFADFVDFDLLSSDAPKDFGAPNGTSAGSAIGDGVFNHYDCVTSKLRNIGNTSFVVHCLNDGFGGNYSEIASFSVAPGETKRLVFNPARGTIIVKLDLLNTVHNRAKAKMHGDGFLYFGVKEW